jgi:hypothetical protein
MVPAAMCRRAMVAVLCAVAVCPIAVLSSAHVARADTAPIAEAPPSDAQLVSPDAASPDAASPDLASLDALSPDSWLADGGPDWSSWDTGASQDAAPPGDDWLANAYGADWSWSDWYAEGGSDQSPPDSSPPPDSSSPEASSPDATAPADAAPTTEAAASSDATPTGAVTADALLSTASTTSTTDAALTTDATLTTDVLAAPTMSVSGTTVSWTPTSGVSSYVFVRKVPGQTAQYSIVNGTSITPPVVPGTTVTYGVRTNVTGSAWAQEVSITYPATTSTDNLAAPTMSVSGTTVSWTPVGTATSYVFVRKVPGQTAQYSIVNGTSITPTAVPGTTVTYGVRTNVTGSAWAQEVSITYPSTTTTSPTPISGTFKMGVAAGSALSYELSFLKLLGAHTARLTYGIGTSASSMASVIDAYARAGIRPLLLATFYGRNATQAEAQNLGTWAATYGPGGSFWAGKTYPANTAVTDIEFGNETSYTYQFSDNSSSTYAARAQTYALRAKDAASAIAAANPSVGLLAQGDNAQQGTAWVTNMFHAVPDLGQRVAGWTIHPYGPNWATRIDSTINSAASMGSAAKPIWVTEWGLSTDNGRCLSDNYGYNKCMTYGEAATTLHTALAGMLSRYGTRLGAFFLYQAHDQYATGTSTGREAYFGGLQSNSAAKGAYTTEVKADLAAH